MAPTIISLLWRWPVLRRLCACALARGAERCARRSSATIRCFHEGYRALNMNGMRQVATPPKPNPSTFTCPRLRRAASDSTPTLKKLEFLKVSVEATIGHRRDA